MASSTDTRVIEVKLDDNVSTPLRRMDGELREAQGLTQTLNKQFTSMTASFISGQVVIDGVRKGFQLLKDVVKQSIQALYESEQANSKVLSVLKAQGLAAKVTLGEMKALADLMAKKTIFDDETVMRASAYALTLEGISQETMPRMMEAAADLATVMGTDLESAVTQLGVSLSDPELGLTRLRRAGVLFSDEQQRMVKEMMAAGKVAEAQNLILVELESRVQGAATAMGDTAFGAAEKLKNEMGNLGEAIGTRVAPQIQTLNEGLAEMVRLIKEAVDYTPRLQELQLRMPGVDVKALEAAYPRSPGLGGGVAGSVARLTPQAVKVADVAAAAAVLVAREQFRGFDPTANVPVGGAGMPAWMFPLVGEGWGGGFGGGGGGSGIGANPLTDLMSFTQGVANGVRDGMMLLPKMGAGFPMFQSATGAGAGGAEFTAFNSLDEIAQAVQWTAETQSDYTMQWEAWSNTQAHLANRQAEAAELNAEEAALLKDIANRQLQLDGERWASEKAAAMKNQLQVFGQMGGGAQGLFGGLMQNTAQSVLSAGAQAGLTGLAGGLEMLGTFITTLVGGIGPLLAAVAAAMPIFLLIAAVVEVLVGMGEVLGPVLDAVLEPVIDLLQLFGNLLGTLLVPIFLAFSPLIQAVCDLLGGILIPIFRLLMPIFNAIGVVIKIAFLPVVAFIRAIGGLINLVLGAINKWIPGTDNDIALITLPEIPTFHSGGTAQSDMLAVLRRDEEVLSPAASRAYREGGGGITIVAPNAQYIDGKLAADLVRMGLAEMRR